MIAMPHSAIRYEVAPVSKFVLMRECGPMFHQQSSNQSPTTCECRVSEDALNMLPRLARREVKTQSISLTSAQGCDSNGVTQ